MRKPIEGLLTVLTGGAAPASPLWEEVKASPITALCYDSRLATEGTVFFCLVGKVSDGHDFALSAYRRGCRFFVAERGLDIPDDAVIFTVPDTREALADTAAAFYDHPERSIQLIGLTGTKGKTTTALLIRDLLNGAGIPTGYIGTNGVDYGDYHYATVNSTPESVEIYRHLRGMLDAGMVACALEVSSQALWMERTRGLVFDSALFLNLSRDHIGGVEHPTMEHYRDSKKRLFTDYPTRAVVAGSDDPVTPYMTEGVTAPVLTFSTRDEAATWYAEGIRPDRRGDRLGVSFTVKHHRKTVDGDWFLPLPGDFNVRNALAALCVVCEGFGVDPRRARELLAVASVTGRFETVISPALPGVTFIIDYAHNGVSLTSILEALAAYAPKRLICLFGSVGGRTQLRRAELGKVAAELCDLAVLTSDNPDTEDPLGIIADIARAFEGTNTPYLSIPDRKEAIQTAVELSVEGDILVLAGKGHEQYQLIDGKKIPFCEKDILQNIIVSYQK